MAVRRLERLEREQDEQDDHDREANLEEALVDKTKVVKLVVDKWFVDRLRLRQSPYRRDRLHSRLRCGGRRGTHDRNRCVGASRERRCSSPGGVELDEPGDKTCGKQRRTKRKRTRWPNK